MTPSPDVVAAFRGHGPPLLLEGGQGGTWQAGEVILKHGLSPSHVEWLDQCSGSIPQDELRLCLPMRSAAGELQIEGWTAFPLLAGHDARGRWHELAAVASTFARAFGEVSQPSFLRRRDDPWACADRAAWGEEDLRCEDRSPLLNALFDARKPVAQRFQLIHGDLTGNVLLASGLPPAVIDISPYWRPAEYAVAIVAVDAVCFFGASAQLLATIDSSPDFGQHVLRALLFRMVTDTYLGISQEERYAVVAEWVLANALAGESQEGRTGGH